MARLLIALILLVSMVSPVASVWAADDALGKKPSAAGAEAVDVDDETLVAGLKKARHLFGMRVSENVSIGLRPSRKTQISMRISF